MYKRLQLYPQYVKCIEYHQTIHTNNYTHTLRNIYFREIE